MSNQNLCITFRFIQPFPLFHGRADADIPEWPPSPLPRFRRYSMPRVYAHAASPWALNCAPPCKF